MKGEAFTLKGEAFTLKGEAFTLKGEAFTLKGEAFMLKGEEEGTTGSPSVGAKLAHHYQFGEILHQKKFVKTDTGWNYVGEAVPFPSSVYTLTGVASDAESEDFNGKFTRLMVKFQEAWTTRPAAFSEAVGVMYELETPARALMANGKWPSFKFLG